jgi:hypothetical protein
MSVGLALWFFRETPETFPVADRVDGPLEPGGCATRCGAKPCRLEVNEVARAELARERVRTTA